jgi:signal transduction histidine kinase
VKLWGTGSLRGQLTRGMIWMQVLVLLTFTTLAAIPIVNIISVDQGRLDPGIIDDAADSIHRNAAGGLDLVPTPALERTIAAYPHAWIYAVDEGGSSVELGTVPSHIGPMLADLTSLESASVADTGDPAARFAIMREHDSTAGLLWIIAAGGPEIGMSALGRALSNPIFLGILIVLVVASFLVIPLIVDHQFRGVEGIAAQADMIDVNQSGVRLSSDKVPDEIHPLVGAINAALQRLDDGIVRRQRFLADAAHELRTPIAVLQTRVEMLPDGAERTRLMLDLARLANLANQLLDLQRLEAAEPDFKPVDLVALAAEVTSEIAPLAIAAGDVIAFDAGVDKVMVQGDAAALARALTNLIQNAIVHGGAGVSITVGVDGDGSLRVSDTGQGVAEADREVIFEPFHRVTPLDHGAGLGLNLVKNIVTKHRGTISVTDAPGGGALFAIRLPVVG